MASGNSITTQLKDTLKDLIPSIRGTISNFSSSSNGSSPDNPDLSLSSNALKMQNRRNKRLINKLKQDLDEDSFPEYKRSISSRIDRLIRTIRMNMDLLEARQNGTPSSNGTEESSTK